MIVILNNKTHVGANPPSDTTKTWISADMTEISIYPEPETYGRLNERIDVKPILLAHNLDIKSNRIRVFSLAEDVLEVKRYINGEWIVIDNPDNYVDIIMNGKVIGTMEVDSIAPDESVAEWDGTGVVITPITPEASPSITINGATYNVVQGMTWFTWASNEEYNTDNFQCLTVDSKVFVAEREDYVVDSDGNAVYGEDLITVGGVYSIEEVSTTDELAGTWLLNAELTPPDSSIDFLVNGTFYTYYDGAYNYYDLKAIWLRIGSLSRNTTIYLRNPADGNTLGAYNGYYPYGRISFADSQVYTNITSDGGIRIRTFTITSNLSEVTNGETLLTWLKANAVKQ